VRASVVRRHDLDVECVVAAFDVVLNAHIRELYVPLVVAGQVVVDGPLLDLFDLTIGAAVPVFPVTIPLLQKPLVLGLQFVVQDHAMDVRAFPAQALRLVQIGAIDLCVVLQFAWSLDAGVECLPVRRVAVLARRFQKVATLLVNRAGNLGEQLM
jgi:hypothetical protein